MAGKMTWDDEHKETLRILAQHLVENTDGMATIGVKPAVNEDATLSSYVQERPAAGLLGKQIGVIDFPDLPVAFGTQRREALEIASRKRGYGVSAGFQASVAEVASSKNSQFLAIEVRNSVKLFNKDGKYV